MKKSAESESDPLAVSVLNDLVLNLEAADELCVPICQDTGMAVVFAEIGKDIHFLGEDFEEAINRGVSK
ncbi:MAG TPA: fumarate hydratase, partial [Oscillospiraceae bacterium]|nr:fumarate hydratase [Oscillospiraceae bacterium]